MSILTVSAISLPISPRHSARLETARVRSSSWMFGASPVACSSSVMAFSVLSCASLLFARYASRLEVMTDDEDTSPRALVSSIVGMKSLSLMSPSLVVIDMLLKLLTTAVEGKQMEVPDVGDGRLAEEAEAEDDEVDERLIDRVSLLLISEPDVLLTSSSRSSDVK